MHLIIQHALPTPASLDESIMSAPAKPKKQRASTSTKNRARSPSPYRSTAETHPEDFMQDFWNHTLKTAENHEDDFKHQALPLARIKKVAKMDPDVQMISSEVTVLFEKACQIFIQELTARAHLVSIESKRRTISRTDVAQAVSKSDTFDFLIDIVPREERAAAAASGSNSTHPSTSHYESNGIATSATTTTPSSHTHQTRHAINVPSTLPTSDDPNHHHHPGLGSPPPPPHNAVLSSSAIPNKRPTRTRKVSEKARQGDQGMYDDDDDDNFADDKPLQPDTTTEGGGGRSNGGYPLSLPLEGGGGGAILDESRHTERGGGGQQDEFDLAAMLSPPAGRDSDLDSKPHVVVVEPHHVYERQQQAEGLQEEHLAKKARIEREGRGQRGEQRGATGNNDDDPDDDDDNGVEDEEDEDDEEEEEDAGIEGDGAFEGWDGLELGFK